MLYDLTSRVSIVPTLLPQVADEGASHDGTAVDTLGFASATVLFEVGTVADAGALAAPLIEESATGVGAWTTVPAARLIGGALPAISGSNDAAVYQRGITGQTKRYLRVVTGAITGGGAGEVPVAASVILGHAKVDDPS
jgi:hypothetical protein